MKRHLISLNEASFRSGLSQIQLQILMRNNLIKSSIDNGEIRIELRILKRWLNRNISLVTELKKDYDQRIVSINLQNYIKSHGKKRVS